MGLVRLGASSVVAVCVAATTGGAALAGPGARTASELDPAVKLRRTDARLRSLLRRQLPNWSPEAPAQRTEAIRLLDNLLDAREMARLALDGRWDKLLPGQQADFVQTLSELAQEAFVARFASPRETEVRYEAATIDGSQARVPAELVSRSEPGGATRRMKLEYRLALKHGEWLVYDVVVDGVSLVDSYRVEFARLLKNAPFEALLARMKRKLETEPRSLASGD
jgi:phospholipid transport system substrate-binding protein